MATARVLRDEITPQQEGSGVACGLRLPRNVDFCGTPSREIEQFGPFGSTAITKRQVTVATGPSMAFARGHLAFLRTRILGTQVSVSRGWCHWRRELFALTA